MRVGRIAAICTLVVMMVFPLGLAPSTPAALNDVSRDNGGDVLVNLANGFPIWYEDENGLKLELCLAQQVTLSAADGGGLARPCLTAEPFLTAPISFPINLGAEAFYWLAQAVTTFTSSAGDGDMLLVMGHEAGFANGITRDGDQTVFSRIRIRINVPVAGTYRVTHPFGTFDYVVPAVLPGRDINQTQDIGDFLTPIDFTEALADGLVPAPGAPADPSINESVVNDDGRSLGPFLIPADPATNILDVNGNLYLANPGTELVPILTPIDLGLNGNDVFRLELLDPPAAFVLNTADGTQIVELSEFQVTGKVFNEGANIAPNARRDIVFASATEPVTIDVAANDVDVRAIDLADPFNPTNPANTNVHGLNPQAVGLVGETATLITQPLTTSGQGTVRRFTDLPTGASLLQYTPPAAALPTGIDTFEYLIQDTGGLQSAPTPVTVVVDIPQLDKADLRVKTMKWTVAGSSNAPLLETAGNGVETYFTGLGGVWNTPAMLESLGSGMADVTVLRGGLGAINGLDFNLQVNGLTGITAAHIHAGALGERGPISVTLFDVDGDISSVAGPAAVDSPLTVTPDSRFPTGDPRNTAIVLDVDDPVNGPFPDLAALVAAIESGDAYIQIHTLANLPGEIRGQLGRNAVAVKVGSDLSGPLVGTAAMQNDGSWAFAGKSATSPGTSQRVSIQTAAGGSILNVPLRLR